ncbi:MAG TPA: AIPR family protein, partial [Pyrinomonadaceae bacterium]|nr:AIPR family protein [Pyrinomonadaceae bacterium]
MIFKIPVSSDYVRTFKDPNHPKIRIVHALVNVSDLPENIPLDPDPRVPKVKGAITKRICDSLGTDDGRFHLLNRGITLSVKGVDFDNKRSLLTLNIPEGDVYGIIDGGHTYKALTTVVNSIHEADSNNGDEEEFSILPNQYVHLEVLEGIEGHLADIADARNFSLQLKAWTLANYRHEFEWFLDALGDDYRKYIKVSENDEEPVGILDLIQVMCAMNPTLFPQSKPPVDAYNSAGKCLDYFIAKERVNPDPNGFRKLEPVCRDIVGLNDYIRFNWKKKYNVEDESGKRGRLGGRTEVQKRKRNRKALATYYFLDPTKEPVQGDLPIEKGLSIPVLSSLRALLEEHNGKFRWTINPFTFFDEHGTDLVKIVMDASESKGGDPHSVGRDSQVYNYLYVVVNNIYLMDRFQ